jgi:hypothetical protein
MMHKIMSLSVDFGIPSAKIPNPACSGSKAEKIIDHDDCVLHDIVRKGGSKSEMTAFHRAGPRSEIHFEPSEVRAAIVTCGGLCPVKYWRRILWRRGFLCVCVCVYGVLII